MATSEILFILENIELIDFYGQNDSKLALVQASYPDLKITPRGNTVRISGEKQRVQEVKHKLELMVKMLQQLGELHPQAVQDMLKGENPFESKLRKVNRNAIVYGRSGKPITPRTRNQKKLVELADINDLVFAIGPAEPKNLYGSGYGSARPQAKYRQKNHFNSPCSRSGRKSRFFAWRPQR